MLHVSCEPSAPHRWRLEPTMTCPTVQRWRGLTCSVPINIGRLSLGNLILSIPMPW
jgi:hypothetical protein